MESNQIVPCISESYIEIKIKLNFICTLLCGASKGFMKTLRGFHVETFQRGVHVRPS